MATHQQTATIVPFPVGGRSGLVRGTSEHRRGNESTPVCDWRGWYHEEAVSEAEKPERH